MLANIPQLVLWIKCVNNASHDCQSEKSGVTQWWKYGKMSQIIMDECGRGFCTRGLIKINIDVLVEMLESTRL